jgi:hypothetical protein
MPVFLIIWPAECPTNQIDRVIKPKNTSLIFDIVITKKMKNLLSLLIIFQIKHNPFKPLGEINWLLRNLIQILAFIDRFILLMNLSRTW